MVAESTAPPCSSYQWGRSVPPPTKLIRSGATASIGVRSGSTRISLGGTPRASTGGPARTDRASGDVSLQPTALLLGRRTPHAVALTVLERPREAFLADRADGAERERRSGLFLGDREEDIGVDPEAGCAVLPEIRGGRVRRKCLYVNVG